MVNDNYENKTGNYSVEVSVIIITYNQEKHIHKTIESILTQKTDFEYEVIIGEDFSSDKTGELCQEYQKLYPQKIRLLPGNENIGGPQKFLQAARSAQGKYIALCEGDDYWTDSHKLQMQYEFLEKNQDCFGIHTKVYYVDTNDNVKGESDLMPLNSRWTSFDYLVQKNVIHTCSFMFRSCILDEKAYSILNATPIPDYTLFLITALKGDIYYLNAITAAYRKNAGVSATWNKAGLIQMRLDIYALLKKHYTLSHHRRGLYATLLYQYFHLYSGRRKGWGNFLRLGHLPLLLWYTLLSFTLKPEIRVHTMSVRDVIGLVFRSRFRLKNWRDYLR